MPTRKVPAHTRRTKNGIINVRAYTATTLMAIRSSRANRIGSSIGNQAFMEITREIQRRTREGNRRAQAIQSYRKQVTGRF